MTTQGVPSADGGRTGTGYEIVREFCEFLQSEEGRQVVRSRVYQPLLEVARGLEQALAPLRTPEFASRALEFLRGLAHFNEWLEQAPLELRSAFEREGIFPHLGLLSLSELGELLVEFRRSGATAAIERLHLHYEALFADSEFRRTLAKRWQASHRWHVLEQVLKAHDAGLYAVSIPTALAQAEGIVADAVGHSGRLSGKQLRDHLVSLRTTEDIEGPAIDAFLDNFLFSPFEHGAPIPRFSRHAILHGADVGYGTKRASLVSMVWVDYLLTLCERFDARV
jgi:hypothetical protein